MASPFLACAPPSPDFDTTTSGGAAGATGGTSQGGAAGAGASGGSSAAPAKGFLLLGSPITKATSEPRGISADGSVIVGSILSTPDIQEAFRWKDGVFTMLGYLPGHDRSEARAANGDGSVVVGNSWSGGDATAKRAFRWTQAAGMADLGVAAAAPADVSCESVDASGNVIVGNASGGGVLGAFLWQAGIGAKAITFPAGWELCAASDVSADGLSFVGSCVVNGVRTGYHRSATGAFTLVPPLPGDTRSNPAAISQDGKVVSGSSFTSASSAPRGFRWSAGSTQELPPLTGDVASEAGYRVDGAGALSGGMSRPMNGPQRAVLWSADNGTRTIQEALGESAMPSDKLLLARLILVTGISGDGRVVTGVGSDGGWRAVIR